MGTIDQMIQIINQMSGEYTPYDIFSDWVKAAAISFANIGEPEGSVKQHREDQYKQLVIKHGRERICKMSELTGLLTIAMEENIEDVLGKLYMQGDIGNKATGQFFTPFHISYMVARMMKYPADQQHILNEPSCGGGGLCIATVKAMLDQGINPQRNLVVYAQDLDWKCVYMTYLQMCALGIKAKVMRTNTLTMEPVAAVDTLYTPAWKGFVF